MTKSRVFSICLLCVLAVLLLLSFAVLPFVGNSVASAESDFSYSSTNFFSDLTFAKNQNLDGLSIYTGSVFGFTVVPYTSSGLENPYFNSTTYLNTVNLRTGNTLVFTAPDGYFFTYVNLYFGNGTYELISSLGTVHTDIHAIISFSTPVNSFSFFVSSGNPALRGYSFEAALGGFEPSEPAPEPSEPQLPADFPIGTYLLSNKTPDFSHVSTYNQALNGAFSATVTGSVNSSDNPLMSSYTVTGNVLDFRYSSTSVSGVSTERWQIYMQFRDYLTSQADSVLIAEVYYPLPPLVSNTLPSSITISSISDPSSSDAYGTLMDWLKYAYTYQTDTPIYQDGFSAGYIEGKEDGFASGVNSAHNTVTPGSASYTAGYYAGVADSNEYTFVGLIGAVIDVPLQAFTSLFNFEILGVNMLSFVSSLFYVLLLIVVAKLFVGFIL